MIDKMRFFATAASAALAFTSTSALAQGMYRWIDNNGRVHYSDKPPTETAKKTEERRLGANVVETSGPDYAMREAAKNFPITLYVAPNCETPCAQARELLTKRGVPFSEVNVIDEKTRGQLKQASGDTQVPVLVVGREVTKGFESSLFNATLDTAGYARTPAGKGTRTAAAREAKPEVRETKAERDERPKGRYLPQ